MNSPTLTLNSPINSIQNFNLSMPTQVIINSNPYLCYLNITKSIGADKDRITEQHKREENTDWDKSISNIEITAGLEVVSHSAT